MSLSDFLVEVEAYDRVLQQNVHLSKEESALSYRSSLFKTHMDRYLITSITLSLPKAWSPKLNYQGLRDKLRARKVTHPTPEEMSQSVIALRSEKLPDPKQLPNVGSFFKNPFCATSAFAHLPL